MNHEPLTLRDLAGRALIVFGIMAGFVGAVLLLCTVLHAPLNADEAPPAPQTASR